MPLAMPNIKLQLESLRKNDWYITAYPFVFYGHEYVIVFEDLREIDRGTKYFAVCLNFLDIKNTKKQENSCSSGRPRHPEDGLKRLATEKTVGCRM